MNVYRIKTSYWDEEDFFIQTTLTKAKINKILKPIVDKEKENEEVLTNDEYVKALKKAYPKDIIKFYTEFPLINFT